MTGTEKRWTRAWARAAMAHRVRTPRWVLALGALLIVFLLVLIWAMESENIVDVEVRLKGGLPDALPRIAALTRSSLVAENGIEVLQDAAFLEAILEEIEHSRTSVHLETFVLWEGEIADRLVERLAEASRRGVEVRLLYDAVGGRLSAENASKLDIAGAAFTDYRPVGPQGFGHINNRTHRKIFVVDGEVGFVGGHGIGDEWVSGWEGRPPFRDTGIRMTGPAVANIQAAFAQNWMKATRECLTDREYWPELEPAGDGLVHVVITDSNDSLSHVALLHELVIAASREEILIANAYFAPDRQLVDLLIAAAERGVRVRMILPGITDAESVRHAGHWLYEDLLEAGVEILEYQPTLLHQKIVVVDRVWAHVGSTNLDARSLELHDEISVGIVDPTVVAELVDAFERDAEKTKRIDLEEFRDRGWMHLAMDAFFYSFKEQL